MLYTLDILTRIFFIFSLSYYSITLMQWYNYSIWRVITKHHKVSWHFYFFVIPIVLFSVFMSYDLKYAFYAFLYLVYIPSLVFWTIKLSKRLVLTKRVWRFFGIVLIFSALNEIIFILLGNADIYTLWIMPFVFALIVSEFFELSLMRSYMRLAKSKLDLMQNLKIITITASYGKTSIKNFLAQILESSFNIHASPRSINTYKGLIADINENLSFGTDIYISEAGARQRGDIAEIATFLNPHIAIIGEIGKAHIEYFKTIENVAKTKFELLKSNRLERVFVHYKNKLPDKIEEFKDIIKIYPTELKNVEATLEGTSFELLVDGNFEKFETKVLGSFNVDNIAVAILCARSLGMSLNSIHKAVSRLIPVQHRFQLFKSNGRIIIDDGFNGNLNGMLEGIRLCSLYEGRKVIVTPGLIESDDESNQILGKAIDSTFDLAIITSRLNRYVLSEEIKATKKIIIKDKNQMENILKACLTDGDLVYFANDAPSYI